MMMMFALLSFLARRLSLMDLDLLGKLLLDFWQVLVGLGIVLVLSIKETLKGANELGRSLGFWFGLFLLFVFLEALEFVLSTRSSLGWG
jgi:hypothetical protein